MSYDINTEPDTGLDWNYTYNVQPMTAKAGLHSLHDLDGLTAYAAASKIAGVILRMEAVPDEYRALEPANGWGDYDGFLGRLRDLHEHLLAYPGTTVRVG